MLALWTRGWSQFATSRRVHAQDLENDVYADFSEPVGTHPLPPARTRETVPNFKHVLLTSIKRLTMTGKMFDVPGFKFFYMLPLSQRFMLQSEFVLNPNTRAARPNYMQMMMGQQKDPYFMMSLNYVGGSFPEILARPAFNLSTRVGTHGMVDFILAKPWRNLVFKLNAVAQNKAGKILPLFALEVEHEGRFSNQQLILTEQSLEMNSFTRLGRRLYLGLELVHAFVNRMTLLSYLAKFKRTPFETYYAAFADMQKTVTLGAEVKVNKKMTLATELEVSDMNSVATLGMQRRFGNLELNSSLSSEGVIKSNFNVKRGLLKLKLFLNAKMKEEDYNTGIHLSIDPMGAV